MNMKSLFVVCVISWKMGVKLSTCKLRDVRQGWITWNLQIQKTYQNGTVLA